jgi:hypothetical protein
MPLPTVLMTEVIRSSHQGQSHGGAHLVNLETGEHRRVLDWNEMAIDWSGRGGGRGLRGIAFHHDIVAIGAGNEIFLFDPAFTPLGSYPAPYCRDCHEIAADNGVLYITATGYDAVLEFDLAQRRYTAGFRFGFETVQISGPHGPRSVPGVVARRFDPNAASGPAPSDTMHINMVSRRDGRTFIAGTGLDALLASPPGSGEGLYRAVAVVPTMTHNCQLFRDGVIYNATASERIVHADPKGAVRVSLPIPRFPRDRLINHGLPEDHARADFGRGLAFTADGIVIGASSPSTITAYDLESGRVVTSVNLTADVRNAPHGLEIWPY